jgi:hypothetical protein
VSPKDIGQHQYELRKEVVPLGGGATVRTGMYCPLCEKWMSEAPVLCPGKAKV